MKGTTVLKLNWKTCGRHGHWCDLFELNLRSIAETGGVYVIWFNGKPGRVVRMGQGNFRDRLAKHRRNPEILRFRDRGLLVTWACVPEAQRDGVERDLANRFPPLVGCAFPSVPPITVNPPW